MSVDFDVRGYKGKDFFTEVNIMDWYFGQK